jgi:hypothetical protein
MSQAKRSALAAAIGSLELGASRESVVTALGAPDSDQTGAEKAPGHAFGGRRFVYYFVRGDPELVNERTDQSVVLWFDEEDRLVEIRSSVREVASRRSD